MTIQECQQCTTSTEFDEWCVLIGEEEEGENQPALHWYLAQIAAEVRRAILSFRKDPPEIKTSDFLIKAVPVTTTPVVRSPKGGIETGEPLDEHWQKVNASAQSGWDKLLKEK